MALFSDFKKFAFKGNVVDLAVGVIIGAAFGNIVKALVDDLIMPVVSLAIPSGDWQKAQVLLKHGDTPAQDVYLKYGDFMGVVLNFLIVGFAMYLLVGRLLTALKLHNDPDVKECPFCLEAIPGKARKCKACTADQPAAPSTAAAPAITPTTRA